jgi:hypothetical protein
VAKSSAPESTPFGSTISATSRSRLDVGFDAQYQYIGDPHTVTVKLTHIHENQQLNSTFLQGNSSNLYNTLTSFKASVGYVYDHTCSLTAAYFDVYGSSDAGLYGATSLANSLDAAYLPFMKGGPSVWALAQCPYWRLLHPLSETFRGVNNFDGAFPNASDNNTVILYSWIDSDRFFRFTRAGRTYWQRECR